MSSVDLLQWCNTMPKILEVILLVVIPLAWGLSINFVFEILRRRRSRRGPAGDSVEADAS